MHPPTLPFLANSRPQSKYPVYSRDEGCFRAPSSAPSRKPENPPAETQSAPGEGPGGAGRGRGPAAGPRPSEPGRCRGLRPRPLTSSSCCRRRRLEGGWPAGNGRLRQRRYPPPWRAGLGQSSGLRNAGWTSPAGGLQGWSRRAELCAGSRRGVGGACGQWCSSRVADGEGGAWAGRAAQAPCARDPKGRYNSRWEEPGAEWADWVGVSGVTSPLVGPSEEYRVDPG